MPRVYVFCIYGNASYFHRNIQYHDNFKKKMLTSEMYRNLLILQLDENLKRGIASVVLLFKFKYKKK